MACHLQRWLWLSSTLRFLFATKIGKWLKCPRKLSHCWREIIRGRGKHVLSGSEKGDRWNDKYEYKVLFDTFLICVVRQCQCLSVDLSPSPVLKNNDMSRGRRWIGDRIQSPGEMYGQDMGTDKCATVSSAPWHVSFLLNISVEFLVIWFSHRDFPEGQKEPETETKTDKGDSEAKVNATFDANSKTNAATCKEFLSCLQRLPPFIFLVRGMRLWKCIILHIWFFGLIEIK